VGDSEYAALQISNVAAASTIPVTSAVAQAKTRKSFRILVIDAPFWRVRAPTSPAASAGPVVEYRSVQRARAPSLPAFRELDLRSRQAARTQRIPVSLNQSRGIDRIKTEATPKQSAAAKVIVNKGSQA
jgi:hypothetical protein